MPEWLISWNQVRVPTPEVMSGRGKDKGQGKGSVSQGDPEEQDATFKLSFLESLDDPQVEAKLIRLLSAATKNLDENISALREEVRTLRDAVAQKDAAIEELRGEMRHLRLQNDALEQYRRRSSLRISGITEDQEDTTQAVVNLANKVLEVDPPLQPQDIDVSHRLAKPRYAREEEPRPIILTFMTRTDRYRILANRKTLKDYNKDRDFKIYVNEDSTKYRAQLFKTVRKLQYRKLFKQVRTYNGNIKVTTLRGEVKSVATIEDIQTLLPSVDLNNLWIRNVILWLVVIYFIHVYEHI